MTERSEGSGDAVRRSPNPADERPAVSYLVRFWLEPQQVENEATLQYRGYARDLRTGEESYFADPAKLVAHIQRRLQAAHHEMANDSEQDQSAPAVG